MPDTWAVILGFLAGVLFGLMIGGMLFAPHFNKNREWKEKVVALLNGLEVEGVDDMINAFDVPDYLQFGMVMHQRTNDLVKGKQLTSIFDIYAKVMAKNMISKTLSCLWYNDKEQDNAVL